MKLYDGLITRCEELFGAQELKSLKTGPASWPETSDSSMILRSEMAYELGAPGLPAVGLSMITSDASLVPGDELFLIGRDLPDIKGDTPYARISFIRVSDDSLGDGNTLYRQIREVEYTRYHFYPEGFMLRVSSSRGKESVRVSRAALAKGLDFEKAGSLLTSAFHRNPLTEAVKTCFITLEDFDYGALEKVSREADEITKTIDHILKNVIMDCTACSLQKVCSEVEGLRELHFRMEKRQ